MSLGKLQTLVIQQLAASNLSDRFYWAGGTLLAEKYLHHRYSHDIDLFTDTPFRYEEVKQMVVGLQGKAKLTKIEEHKIFDRWEFFLHNHEEVRCEFVWYNFPALQPRRRWKGVLVDSLEDASANKLMAALERHEPKDVVDLYFILIKTRLTLYKMLKLTGKKFGLKVSMATCYAEILRGCENLSVIKPLLFGSSDEQQTTIHKIQKYFSTASARWLRNELR